MKKISRRKIWLIGALIVILGALIFLYLNRSYSFIYQKIDEASLRSPDRLRTYLITNNMSATKTPLVYSALGDSLTSGVGADTYEESFPYLLAQYLAGNDYQVTLKNRSVPGAKTSDLLVGLLPGAIKDNPDVVTLLIGVNDLHGNIAPSEFAANYEEILSRLKKETKAQIYVINLPLVGADNLLLPPQGYLFNLQTKKLNTVIKTLAAKYQVKYIDLYTPTYSLFKEPGAHYATDLFHPSALGYKIWADLIYANFNQ